MNSQSPGTGKKWDADDLADGLKLAALVCRKTWVNQIATVDVRNYDGRINRQEPFLRLTAKDRATGRSTDIRFGQLQGINAPGEVPTDRKLKYIDTYVTKHNGVLAGLNRFLDLRFDDLLVSND